MKTTPLTQEEVSRIRSMLAEIESILHEHGLLTLEEEVKDVEMDLEDEQLHPLHTQRSNEMNENLIITSLVSNRVVGTIRFDEGDTLEDVLVFAKNYIASRCTFPCKITQNGNVLFEGHPG